MCAQPSRAGLFLFLKVMCRKTLACLFLLLIVFALPLSAQRVVSLLPSATYAAAQMGADANIVGRTSYCPAPSKGVKSTIIGDAMTVNLEVIVSLKPDVVIISPFTAANVVSRLKGLNIKTVSLLTPTNFSEICEQAILVGQLTGHEAQARQMVADESRKVESLTKAAAKPKSPKLVYIQIGVSPIWGATPDYYINEIATRLGLTNVLAEGEGACSREAVLARHPAVVVVSSLGGLGKAESEWWTAKGSLSAVVDENCLCCPTPRFFRMALESVNSLIVKLK